MSNFTRKKPVSYDTIRARLFEAKRHIDRFEYSVAHGIIKDLADRGMTKRDLTSELSAQQISEMQAWFRAQKTDA